MHILYLYVCFRHRNDSGWRPSCLCVQNWTGLRQMGKAQRQAPLQPWQICGRSTRSLRSFKWMMMRMMTCCLSFWTLLLLMEYWATGTCLASDQRTVIIMTIYRCDRGVPAAIETTGQNPPLSVCEASPLHLLHACTGLKRYNGYITCLCVCMIHCY